MKIIFTRTLSLLLAMILCSFVLTSCFFDGSSEEASGTHRDLSTDDLDVDTKVSDNEKDNSVSAISYKVECKGKDSYVYFDCTIEVVWTYELMDEEGVYQEQTFSVKLNLDKTGAGSTTESQAVYGCTTRNWNKTIKVANGTVSAK